MKRFALFALIALVLISGCTQQQESPETTIIATTLQQETTLAEETTIAQETTVQAEETSTVGEVTTTLEESSTIQPEETITLAEPTVREFSMTAKRFSFDPGTITVNQGDIVRITLTTTDVAHGLGIREYNIDEEINPGEEKIIEFTANKRGTFTFYCSVFCGGGHRGMTGTLIVE